MEFAEGHSDPRLLQEVGDLEKALICFGGKSQSPIPNPTQ
ncbi:hypothetical protein FDUTEX481_08268 [Tolypothrix sp. PCC 7601]|nr:hypothetical protein FDUTEX481_08268 [Tolypothrix sp. PCC 7601]